jgi:DNA-binding HxlR family transcriptional regulator
MRQKLQRRSDCPIGFALDIFGDRWTLLIVRDLLFFGKTSYGDFLSSKEGIATNILADRLETLERAGIVKKASDIANKTKFIYSLTAKGIDLLPALLEIIVWSAKYDSKTAAPKEFVAQAKSNREQLIKQIKTALKQNKILFQQK